MKLLYKLKIKSNIQKFDLLSSKRRFCFQKIGREALNFGSPNVFPRNILFFGNDDFSLETLKALRIKQQEGVVEKLHVVSQPVQKSPHAVSKFCKEIGIPLYDWPFTPTHLGFDIGIVVSFGHLITEDIIAAFPLGMLNVHGSLLPRWRGSSPVAHAILNADPVTGVSVMKIQPHKFDIGEVLLKEQISIPEGMKTKTLTSLLAKLGSDCLIRCLENLETFSANSQTQSSVDVTNAPKLVKRDSRVVWSRMPGHLIRSMYLAMDDLHPLWTTWLGREIKLRELTCVREDHPPPSGIQTKANGKRSLTAYHILKGLRNSVTEIDASSIELQNGHEKSTDPDRFSIPGQVNFSKISKRLNVQCANGFVEFKSVALKGKKHMSAVDFYNGFLSKCKFHERFFL